MTLYRELEEPREMAWSLDVSAVVAASKGDVEGAATLWGASDGLLESVGGSLVPTVAWIRDRCFEPVKTHLGDHLFATARAEERAMSPEQAVTLT